MPSFRAQSRNPPCTLFFLAPFAEGFQFYFVTHTTLYRCARKIEGFARDDVAGRTRFPAHTLYDTADIHSLHCHFERSEKSFSSPFSTTPSLSLLGEAPSPPFLRYGVSHFSLPNTRPLTANEKDPSAPLGMTIREKCFLSTAFAKYAR